MPDLPEATSHTVTKIYESYQAQAWQSDSIGLPVSLVGHECDRLLWYTLRWASEGEQRTGKQLRRLQTGLNEEMRLFADLHKAGFKLYTTDPVTNEQLKCYLLGGHLRGKLDGAALGLPEAPEQWHVVETKALNEKRWKAVVKHGVEKSESKHWLQCQLYMHGEGLPWCLYLAANTNSDELHAERIAYDADLCAKLLHRLRRVIEASRAPSKISEDPSKWPCVFCEHKEVCHGSAFGRSHCRSCVHSTPMVGDGKEAEWGCEKFHKMLSYDDQKAGCPAHIFLPDLVPGEQVDAGDDFVVYKLHDGSTWRDGAP